MIIVHEEIVVDLVEVVRLLEHDNFYLRLDTFIQLVDTCSVMIGLEFVFRISA